MKKKRKPWYHEEGVCSNQCLYGKIFRAFDLSFVSFFKVILLQVLGPCACLVRGFRTFCAFLLVFLLSFSFRGFGGFLVIFRVVGPLSEIWSTLKRFSVIFGSKDDLCS